MDGKETVMEKVCPFCGKPVADGDTVCTSCGRALDQTTDNHAETITSTSQAAQKPAGSLRRKVIGWTAAAVALAGICYAARHSGNVAGSSSAAIAISAPAKVNPVSGNQIVAVTKPLYIIKEDDMAYTNIQWATALCPELRDYIPSDIPELEAMANNEVKISGSSVRIDLAPLAGITPIVFSDIGNGSVTPASIPDEEIEIVYGYRDGITLYGTITDFGTTREMANSPSIHYGKHSGNYDKNEFNNNTVYYINGTIDRLKNNVRSDNGFTSGYKETVYHHEGMFLNMKRTHGNLYTYPGVTERGKEGIYNSDDELTGYQDVEYQAFSRFQILYFPDQDMFQVDILLLDQGSLYMEMDDGNGRHEDGSSETDHIYRIMMLSDYNELRSVDEWYEYIGHDYIIVNP